MGDRGPAATMLHARIVTLQFSRWEIGDQPQLTLTPREQIVSLADGRSGTSRNRHGASMDDVISLADGRSGTSRN